MSGNLTLEEEEKFKPNKTENLQQGMGFWVGFTFSKVCKQVSILAGTSSLDRWCVYIMMSGIFKTGQCLCN